MSDEIEVDTMNLNTGLVSFTDGTSGRVVDMMDEDGEDTEDPDYAIAVIVEHKVHGRFFVELPDDFEDGSLQ